MKKLNLISPIIGEYFDDLIKDHSDRVSDIILVDCAKFSTISIKKEYIINNVELYHEFTVDNVNYLLLFFRNNEYYITEDILQSYKKLSFKEVKYSVFDHKHISEVKRLNEYIERVSDYE